jgi:excisionase family DNA binding protein
VTTQQARRSWTPQEAADQLGISYRRVLDLIHGAQIRSVKVGRTYLIPTEALDELLGGRALWRSY